MTLVCASTIVNNLAFVRRRRGTINRRSSESDRTAISDRRTPARSNEKIVSGRENLSQWKMNYESAKTKLRFGALEILISCLWHFSLFLLANWYKLWAFVVRPSSLIGKILLMLSGAVYVCLIGEIWIIGKAAYRLLLWVLETMIYFEGEHRMLMLALLPLVIFVE